MSGVYKLTHGPGLKMRLEDLPEESWRIVLGQPQEGDVQALFRAVPWLNRGISILGNGVANLPFVILDSRDNEIDSNVDYRNVTGLWADPFRDLWLFEASLNLTGSAYALKLQNRGKRSLGLRYLAPGTVTPVLDAERGLVGFRRAVGQGQTVDFKVEDILHVYAADPFNEIGRPANTRAAAALAAAQVLKNSDDFIATYFERGMVKTTLLSVPAEMLPADIERAAGIWARVMKGIKSAYEKLVINAGAAVPIVVGEGLAELANTELTSEKREDISTALGVPHSLLFSNAANFATAEQDQINYYRQTIIPDARKIARAINEQYLEPAGYRLQFQPEAMDIFQEDEEDRSGALVNLVNAVIDTDPKVAATLMQLVGIELPGGMEWDEFERILADAKAERRERAPEINPQPVPGTLPERERDAEERQNGRTEAAEDVKALYADLERWERKALKRLKTHPDAACEFDSPHIPADLALLIEEMLSEATTPAQVRAVFSAREAVADA